MHGGVGDLVFRFDDNPTYTQERQTGGEAGTFVVNVTQLNDSPRLTVTIQVRRSKDTTFTDVVDFEITDVGTHTQDVGSGNFGRDWLWRLAFTFATPADPLDAARLTYGFVPRPC